MSQASPGGNMPAMLMRMGRFNLTCLALTLITFLLCFRSTLVEDRFVWARDLTSQAWIAAAEHAGWGRLTPPKVISNIEYHEIGIGAGRVWLARSRWAQRETNIFGSTHPTAIQLNARKAATPWDAPNTPGFFRICNDIRLMREPIGHMHLGWSYGKDTGRTYVDPPVDSTFLGEPWLKDITELSIPLWAIAALLMIPPAVHVVRIFWRRCFRKSGICTTCGYDLRASNERCPECGSEILSG